jgi:hypothetical protein
MATYRARMLDGETGSDGTYDFEWQEGLMNETPVRVVRAFFERVDRAAFPTRHVDYEINAALKNRERGIVTCMGSLHFEGGAPPAPFLLMVAQTQG